MRWCADKGLPHSELLSWDDSDRAKLTAYLLEESNRCSSCGTYSWDWDEDRFAYSTAQHHCQGCFLLDAAAEDTTERTPGSRMVLLPKAKAAEIAQRPSRPPGV